MAELTLVAALHTRINGIVRRQYVETLNQEPQTPEQLIQEIKELMK